MTTTLAIRCGTLIDGNGGEPLRHATVVIQDETIVAVQPNGEIPRDATVIDASGMTVMPGMIDCHVHLAVSNLSLEQRLLTPYSLTIAQALANAHTTLEAGFTSVRDAHGTPRGVKMAIERGLFPGPRLRIAVGALSQTGGHGDTTMPNGANIRVLGPEHPHTIVDGVDQVRKGARELLRAGADVIKIYSSGGVVSPNDEPGVTGFTPEEISAIVYEAHAAGKTVMAHAQARQGILNAVLCGVESIEHGVYLDEEVVAAMKARGTFLVPTLVAPLWLLRRAKQEPGSVPPYAVRKAQAVKEAHLASFRLAVESGVKIAMGTDTGVGPHGSNAEELRLMVEGGMTPMQAIVAATRTAAECVRIDRLTGTLEPGKRADLLAVDGDPLDDVAVLQQRERLALIMQEGRIVKSTLGATVDERGQVRA